MKRIFGLLLLFVAINVSALEINSKLSGIWYNANQSGHGLNVVILDENTTIIYWYVYHTDGTPMFLLTVGNNEGNRTVGTTYYHTGMKFGEFDPNDVKATVWGTSTLTFSDCNTASLQYSSNEPGYGSGTIPMERLASVAGLKCTNSPLHGSYIGIWTESSGAITGVGIATLFENGDIVFGAGAGDDGSAGVGRWWITGIGRASFQANVYSVFGGLRAVTGNATFDEDGLVATYTGNGKLTAFPIPSFQKSLNIGQMAGSYNIYDWEDYLIGSVVIQNNGTISGSTYNGCQLVGQVTVPNTEFNQIAIDSSVSNCASTVRIYGAAVYIKNEIHVAATDNWYGYIWKLKLK